MQVDLGYGGQIGGTVEGIRITISGLFHSATPSTPALNLAACLSCSQPEYTDIRMLIPSPKGASAQWDQESGDLVFHLRPPGPTYLIDKTVLRALVPLLNGNISRQGSIPLVTAGSSLLRGIPEIPPTPLGSKRVLSAQISAQVVTAHVDYYKSTAYARPLILLRFTMTYDVMYGDAVVITAPSLTTCTTFCHQGECLTSGCGESTRTFYVSARVTSSNNTYVSGHNNASGWAAGDGLDFMTATWTEADKRLVLQPSAGRALCEGEETTILLSPEDCSNITKTLDRHECMFQVLPDDFTHDASKHVEAKIQGCQDLSSACKDYRGSAFSNSPVDTQAGFYWSQGSDQLDDSCAAPDSNASSTNKTMATNVNVPNGRAWFVAQVHNNVVFVLGGITPCGPAKSTRATSDGIAWESVHDELAPFPRSHFTAESFRGFLWVFGGRNLKSGLVVNDIWRSENGSRWEKVIVAAEWQAREMHATVVFRDQLWVIAGRNNASQALCDVWNSPDGRNWTLRSICAPFSSRFGHGITVFKSKLWVYGGGESSSDVWWSQDGIEWAATTVSAPWSNRRAAAALSFDGRLWLVGGYQDFPQHRARNDVWYSSDGIKWITSTDAGQWGLRYGAQAFVFNNRSSTVLPCPLSIS